MGILNKKIKHMISDKFRTRFFKKLKELNIAEKDIQFNSDGSYEINQQILIQIFPKGKFKVEYECDDCHKIITARVDGITQTFDQKGAYLCNKCSQHRTVKDKYNVDCTFSLDTVRNKIKQTNLEKYGCEYSSQSSIIKEKISKSLKELYTDENYNRTINYKQREIKKIATVKAKYGEQYTSVSQVPDIRQRIIDTMSKHGKIYTSAQQMHICELVSGKLNYPIKYYPVDIALENDKIIIEYDGGGHTLSVKFGKCSMQEFKKREIIRDKCIIGAGWKIIRLIAENDKLLNDDELLKLINQAKQYLINTEHHWINIDLENDNVKCASFMNNFDIFLQKNF